MSICRHCGRRIYWMEVRRPGAAAQVGFWEHTGGARRCKPSGRKMAEPIE